MHRNPRQTRRAAAVAAAVSATLAALGGVPSEAARAAPVAEKSSLPDARQSLAVTIYNDDRALVKEVRRLDLSAGENRIALREVAAQIRPETASLRSLSGAGFGLVEQNFDFDLLTPATLLRKYVGRAVTVIRTNPATGAETREQATVLATNEGVVLKYADRIESAVGGRIAYGDVPADLRERPTLSVTLSAPAAGPQDAELMYLTGGLGWKADYAATLDASGTKMNLTGWVTLTNRSGTRYDDAKLQLVAGNLNRVREEPARDMALAPAAVMKAASPQMAEEKLFEYHMYTLDRPTTILDNQVKQVALLSADAVPVTREYLLQGGGYYYQGRYPEIGRKLKPSVYVAFENKGGSLGRPLPKGTVRVYTRDSQGGAQLIGEDAIDHTPRNERVRLKLGEAFDLTADRIQTDAKKIADRAWQTSYRIEIRNADRKEASVKVLEPLPGLDWTITSENRDHVKESSTAASWVVPVPAEGSATLEYTVLVRW